MPTYLLSTNRRSVQQDPFILQLKNGHILGLWSDLSPDPGTSGSFGVYGRTATADLRAGAPTDIRINNLTDDIQRSPTATSFGNSGFAVIFESRGPSAINGHDDAYFDSYIRFYNPDGSAKGAAKQLTPNGKSDHYAADTATLSNGQSVTLVARYESGGIYDLLAYRHGPGGAQIAQPVRLVDNIQVDVSSWTGADYAFPSIAAGANGTYAVSWHERTSSGDLRDYAVYTQVYRADGSALGPTRVVAPVVSHPQEQFGLGQSEAEITGTTTGRWAVAWNREEPNVLEGDVYFRLLNANGTGATGAFMVNSDRRAGEQVLQDVVDLGAGRTLVTYFNYVDDAIDGLFDGGLLLGRVFGPNGKAVTGSFRISENGHYYEMGGGNTIINGAGQIVASFSAELDYAFDTDVLGVVRPLTLPAVHGGAGNNRISGTFVNDVIHGQGGHDVLTADRGNDSLYGGAGNDTLSGGSGRDRLDGGAGNDLLNGGAGADRTVGGFGNDIYRVDNKGDLVSEAANRGTDVVQSSISYALTDHVENLTLTGTGNLNGTGNALANRTTGNAGNNSLNGGGGADRLTGAGGNDQIVGGAGNDTLIGGPGRDLLNGGAGNDLLLGGPGADRFVFNSGTDTVRDFNRTQDVIDLRSFSDLDSWADVRGHLSQAGTNVAFRMNGHVLRIEDTSLASLAADDFLW